MRYLYGLIAFLTCSASALATATLSYSGTDISTTNGTLTITCTDSSLGNLWSMGITRTSSGSSSYIATITNFQDLTNSGTFNYGLGFHGNFYTYTSGSNVYSGTFSQITKTSSAYSYSVTIVNALSGVSQWSQVATYTINPSNSTNSQFTCQTVTTNTSGSNQTSQSWMSYIFYGWVGLNPQPWDYTQGGTMSAYQGSSSPYYQQQLESNGTTLAVWQTTDNLNGSTNPGYVAGGPAWGQGVVMNTPVATGTGSGEDGLVAGRTFYFDTDIDNNSTNSTYFACDLNQYNEDLEFAIRPYNWGDPATWVAGTYYTHNYTLTINIVASNGAPVAVVGADEAVQDTNGSGDGTGTTPVALSSTGSSPPPGGNITYTWTWTDSVSGVTTQHTASGASPTVNLYSGLYDGYQNLNNGINDITLTVKNTSTGQSASATQRVWIYPKPTYYVATNGLDTNSGTSSSSPFKTIGKGISSANGHPGDVVMVAPGVYYESDSFQGNGNSTAAGASACGQITVMGMPTFPQQPSNNVIIDASDPLTNWTACPSTINGFSVPNYTHIWYTNVAQVAGVNTNINWASTHVTEDGKELICASVPLASGNASTTGGTPYETTGGYYATTGGTANTQIIDTTHLQNNANYPNGFFNGANVIYQQSDNQTGLAVSSFVSSTGTLNVTGGTFSAPVSGGDDGYLICNLPELMNIAGTYADVLQSNGTYNVYVWTYDGSNPSSHVVTAGHRNLGLGVGYHSDYWTADNIEVRHVEAVGSGSTGFGTGSTSNTSTGFIYQNCLADHINSYGFYMQPSSNCIITRCASVYNHDGMEMIDCANGLIQYCEIGWCWEDGVRIGGAQSNASDGDTITVDSCYDHDCTSFNHADGIQVIQGNPGAYLTAFVATNILQDNVGDELQSQNVDYLTWNNNLSIGSATNGVFPQANNNTVESNTIFDCGLDFGNEGTPTAQTWVLMNNVHNSGSRIGNVPQNTSSFISNYNDWWVSPGGLAYTPVVDLANMSGWNATWAQYQTDTGQDANSYGNCQNGANPSPNPLLTNVPGNYQSANESEYYSNTPTTIYLGGVTGMAVNDYIEINWDGVLRQITAINSTNNYITFTPADYSVSQGELPTGVADWGATSPNLTLNFTFPSTSPAYGTSSTHGNMGCPWAANIANWFSCDFHGTGRREIPADPTP